MFALSACLEREAHGSGTSGNWLGPFDWDSVATEDCETATHMMALRGGGDTTIVLHLHGTKQGPPCHRASPRVMVIPPGLSSPQWGSLATKHVPPPIGEPDLFCCGHAALADGRMLFVGGTSLRNNGHKGVQVFDPRLCLVEEVTVDGMQFRNGWAVVDTMRRDRWYPTTTPLPDGRVLVSSGLRHFEMMSFGGMKSATEAVAKKPDVLALPRHAFWSRYGQLGSSSYRAEPSERRDHTMVYSDHSRMHDNDGGGVVLVQGGVAMSGAVLDELWVGWRVGFDEAEAWSWIQPIRTQWPAAFVGRYEHSAVAVPGSLNNSTALYLFGGRKDASTATDELWRLQFAVVQEGDAGNDTVGARLIPTTGPSPGARYGHTAILDEKDEIVGQNTVKRRRMLVFGGRTQGGALADDAVYSLDLGANPPTWNVVTPASPSGSDKARYRHVAVMDGPSTYLFGTKPRRMIVHGGQTASGLSNETLVLRRCDTTAACLGSYLWEASAAQTSATPARYQHAAVYDAQWHRMLVFGGQMSLAGGAFDGKVYELPLESADTPPYNTPLAWSELGTDSLAADIEPRAGHATIWNPRYVVEKYAEVFDPTKPAGQQWSEVPNAPIYDQWTYPFYFMLPSGSMFYAGRSTRSPGGGGTSNNDAETRLLSMPGADPNGWAWGAVRHKSFVGGNGAVMFAPGKVMKFGQPRVNPAQPHADVKRIEFLANDATTGWASEAQSPFPDFRPRPRFESNQTLLPDGNVLVSGGRDRHKDDGLAFLSPQIWTPGAASGTWSRFDLLDPDLTSRGYHSTAILTPDGRVLSAGGSRLNNPSASVGLDMRGWLTVFEPPYLYNAGGSTLASRPALSAVPDTILYGNCHTLQVAAIPLGLSKLSLVRPGATTHAFNMDQYHVTLASSHDGLGGVTFNAPVDGNTAPPGEALVFAVANTPQGTPSLGEWVTVGPRHDVLDPLAPSAVGAFSVIPDHCGQFVRAYWTERPDDSTFVATGRVRLHDVRWSTSGLSGWSQFQSAAQIACEPAPRGPGAQLSVAVTLAPGSYSFRHVSWDDRWPYTRSSAMSVERTLTLDGCGGGGGGGPFIDGDGEGGGLSARRAAEAHSGSPLAASATTVLGGGGHGEVVSDELRLDRPVRIAPDRVRVRVHRGEGGSSRIVSAALTAVDRGAGAEVARLAGAWAAVTRLHATAAAQAGSHVGDRLEGRADLFLVGDAGDSVAVSLPTLPAGLDSSLVYVDAVAARAAGRPYARLKLGGDGAPRVLAPRGRRATQTAGMFGGGDLSLVFEGNAAVHGIGRLVPTGESLGVAVAALLTATHSRLGPVDADSLASGTDVRLLAGDTLSLEFAEPPLVEGRVRELWLSLRGSQEGAPGTLAGRSREVREEGGHVAFALLPARPNPARGSVTLPFALPRAGLVRLELYDLQGRRVHEHSQWRPAGRHEQSWDLRDRDGGRVAPGVYSFRLLMGAERAERRLVVLP